jgi:hypothetical protein
MKARTSTYLKAIIPLLAFTSLGQEAQAAPQEKQRLEIYGFVQMDAIYDFNRVDPDWAASLRPSKIPVNCPGDAGCGQDGQTIMSVRQSRLGFKGYAPTDMGEIQAKFEFDMFGVGVDAGQTTIRLRHAYGEMGAFLAGQTNSLFMDGDVFPNTVEYWGPSGMIFFRNLQLRWTPLRTDTMKFAVALEGPGSAVDAGNATNPDGWGSWNKYPDLTAQLRTDQPWGHAQVAGIVRWLGFENPTNPLVTKDSGHVIGSGINLSGSLKTGGKDQLLAQLAYGKGIANYSNDCCVDVAPNSLGNDAEAVPLLDWLVYYDHYWNDKWSTSVGYSQNVQDNTGGQLGSAQHMGEYASVNLLYYPAKNVLVGGEFMSGVRENKDGNSGTDTRVQFSAKYSF